MNQDDRNNFPEEFLCPISQEIMKDPVIAADGHTYDRKNITKWLSNKTGRCKSPLNGNELRNNDVTDNIFARKFIKDHNSIKLFYEKQALTTYEKEINEKNKVIITQSKKIDQFEKNQILIDQKKEIENLKNQISEQKNLISSLKIKNAKTEKINCLKKQILEKEEINKNLSKENSGLKKLNIDFEKINKNLSKENSDLKKVNIDFERNNKKLN